MKRHLSFMRVVSGICAAVLLLSALAVGVDVTPLPDRPTERPKAPAFAPLKIHPDDYTGRVRLYMVEPVSKWDDYNGNSYHFGFLDFPLDSAVILPDGNRYHRSYIWDASEAGYWAVKPENIMVIGALFNSESHPANSDTIGGSAYPFDAYYVDAAAAAEPGQVDSNTTTGSSTHTVLVQVGTATWCPSCPATNYWLNQVYKAGAHNFYFTEMVVDKNNMGDTFMDNQYNLAWLPTSYYDGGDEVLVGGYTGGTPYINKISSCEARSVPDVGLIVGFQWLGNDDDKYQIELAIAHGTPVNSLPNNPLQPSGPGSLVEDTTYDYTVSGSDPEGDPLRYRWDWGDGDTSGWVGPYDAGVPCTLSHSWADTGTYEIKVKSRDPWYESGWSTPLTVTVKCCNHDGIRGDVDYSGGSPNVGDLAYLVSFLFDQPPGPAPPCFEEADVDATGGIINVGDLAYLVSFLFEQPPGPAPLPCD